MILDLREFDEFPAEVRLVAETDEAVPFAREVVEVSKIEVGLAIQNAGDEFFCQGRTLADVKLVCARCLGSFQTELNGRTDFIIRSEQQSTDRSGRPVIDDEDYVSLMGNNLRADIFEPVRQSLVVEVPLRPLCHDNCKGLCPSCGVNRNKISCRCHADKIDNRWEGLIDLSQQ